MRNRSLPILALCTALAVGACADWPTFHGDHALRGVAAHPVPSELQRVWQYAAGAPVEFTPVAGGGRIYAAVGNTDVVGLDGAGRETWRVTLAGRAVGRRPPAVAAPLLFFRGFVAAVLDSGELVALDAATGKEHWRADLGGRAGAAPNWIAAEGRPEGLVIAVVQAEGVAVALDGATGREVWRSPALERCDSPPSCGEGIVALGSCLSALHALDARDGAERFRAALGEDSQIAGGAALDRGRAYVGARSGALSAIDLSTGKVVWHTEPRPAELFAAPAIAGDLVVFATEDGIVHAADRATGAIRWSRATARGPAEVAVAGTLAIVSADGALHLLNLRDGELVHSVKISDRITGPALSGGRVIVGTDEGRIVAYGAATAER